MIFKRSNKSADNDNAMRVTSAIVNQCATLKQKKFLFAAVPQIGDFIFEGHEGVGNVTYTASPTANDWKSVKKFIEESLIAEGYVVNDASDVKVLIDDGFEITIYGALGITSIGGISPVVTELN